MQASWTLGAPVTFTPHDFRRLFATELVDTGLPLQIVSTLLGHLNLETTRDTGGLP
ncbi:tyrosine-type recombinase/integrase [Arthrobacter sp. Soil762]|uniref:tyrosine-type recombinase/integrase n=1 Tax=Arthrobacter sp. Soil762 TaxID=1736401 RepID=UPI000AA9B334|nr:site-specific integrase [Arthrobacter sp. Soil762]